MEQCKSNICRRLAASYDVGYATQNPAVDDPLYVASPCIRCWVIFSPRNFPYSSVVREDSLACSLGWNHILCILAVQLISDSSDSATTNLPAYQGYGVKQSEDASSVVPAWDFWHVCLSLFRKNHSELPRNICGCGLVGLTQLQKHQTMVILIGLSIWNHSEQSFK